MKPTQTHVWSLAGEEAVSYSLARGKAAAVTRESGEIAAYSLAPWPEQSLALVRRLIGAIPIRSLPMPSSYAHWIFTAREGNVVIRS